MSNTGLFTEATLQQIRNGIRLEKITEGLIPDPIICPFCNKSGFKVHSERQLFHCFKCHKGGDVFTFAKDYYDISFEEAVRRLAIMAGVKIP